jgi:hypothetical protein
MNSKNYVNRRAPMPKTCVPPRRSFRDRQQVKRINFAFVLIACFGVSGLAFATSPAIPENIVCGSPHVFIAKVLAVKSVDCRLKHPRGGCSPVDHAELSVHIDRILRTSPLPPWASDRPLRAGVSTQVTIGLYSYSLNKYPALMVEDEKAITDDIASALLQDKTFVFTAWGPTPGPIWYGGTATDLSTVGWFEETLKACADR